MIQKSKFYQDSVDLVIIISVGTTDLQKKRSLDSLAFKKPLTNSRLTKPSAFGLRAIVGFTCPALAGCSRFMASARQKKSRHIFSDIAGITKRNKFCPSGRRTSNKKRSPDSLATIGAINLATTYFPGRSQYHRRRRA